MKSNEFARRQGVDPKTVRRWYVAGKLNARKVNAKTILIDDENPFREQTSRQEVVSPASNVMAKVEAATPVLNRSSEEVDRRLNELERRVGQNETERALPARDRPSEEMNRRLAELEQRVQQDEKDAAIVQYIFLALVIIIVLLMAAVLASLMWR